MGFALIRHDTMLDGCGKKKEARQWNESASGHNQARFCTQHDHCALHSTPSSWTMYVTWCVHYQLERHCLCSVKYGIAREPLTPGTAFVPSAGGNLRVESEAVERERESSRC
jgi:hypothetical protein